LREFDRGEGPDFADWLIARCLTPTEGGRKLADLARAD
jgi:hypothetical protein